MRKGRIRRAFPGNNTSEGFFSFFEYIIGPEARKVFIIKGGPGTGKSTFMKNIGMELVDRGYDVEFFHCASDNDSLDAIAVPAVGAAIIDGTAPHVVDPSYPGAVDVIINLGDYWDEDMLARSKERIVDLHKRIRHLFLMAFNSLKEARVVRDELASYYAGALDQVAVDRKIADVYSDILAGTRPAAGGKARVRRLFASANTPNGPVNHLDSLLEGTKRLYLLKGEPGTGQEKALEVLLSEALRLGMDCEAYHCPLDPHKLEAVNIPAASAAAVRLSERLAFSPEGIASLEELICIDFNRYVNEGICQAVAGEIIEANERLKGCFLRAWRKLGEAKTLHDDLEKLYVASMKFTEIDRIRERTLNNLLVLGDPPRAG